MLDFVNYGADYAITISLQEKSTSNDFTQLNLPCLYPQYREIGYPKYKDLQKLIQYIPKQTYATDIL